MKRYGENPVLDMHRGLDSFMRSRLGKAHYIRLDSWDRHGIWMWEKRHGKDDTRRVMAMYDGDREVDCSRVSVDDSCCVTMHCAEGFFMPEDRRKFEDFLRESGEWLRSEGEGK